MGGASYGWGIRKHGAIAQIAESHLAPQAKALLKEYLGGKPMAYYAYDAEIRHEKMLIEIDGKRVVFSHTFDVDMKLNPSIDVVNKSGQTVDNMLGHIDIIAKNLKENHRTMNDSVRLVHLYCIIHSMGDMHCPMHIELDVENPTPHGKYRLKFKDGDKTINKSMHGLWEMRMIGVRNPWGSSDLAQILDTYTDEQIAEICKGDSSDWGEETAREALSMRNYKPNDVINPVRFKRKNLERRESLLCKAGYRLAKLLNVMFE